MLMFNATFWKKESFLKEKVNTLVIICGVFYTKTLFNAILNLLEMNGFKFNSLWKNEKSSFKWFYLEI